MGHHAVQLLSQSGYRVIAVASTARHEAILRLGAVACFDYKDGDVVDKIRRAAGDNGIRAAYDTAASNGSTDMCIGQWIGASSMFGVSRSNAGPVM